MFYAYWKIPSYNPAEVTFAGISQSDLFIHLYAIQADTGFPTTNLVTGLYLGQGIDDEWELDLPGCLIRIYAH